MALENKAQKAKRESLEALPRIVQATLDPAANFTYCSEEVTAWLVKNGFAETKTDFKNDHGDVATRATEKGIAYYNENLKPKEEKKESKKMADFVIETGVEYVKPKRAGNPNLVGNSIYPFDKLEVGQSFFVADKEAAKMQGTIASANKRYAVEVKDENGVVQTRVNRKGATVPQTKQEREFKVSAAEKDGVKGVRIFRIL